MDVPYYFGIEGGGTRTVAICADAMGKLVKRAEGPPSNLRLVSDAELVRIFASVTKNFPTPSAVGIGLAGVRDSKDEARIERAAAQLWPGTPCVARHDLETALAAAGPHDGAAASVIVLSGTGSCCYGASASGRRAKVGGWGHIIGDKGSGFEIGLRALKAVVYYLDRDGTWSLLGRSILRDLLLNEPNDLIGWAQKADKKQIAALARIVFDCRRDPISRDILKGAAHTLARDAATCAKRLARSNQAVRFIFAGSVLLKQRRFAAQVGELIRKEWPKGKLLPLEREGAWGAVFMAQEVRRAKRNPASGQVSAKEERSLWIPESTGLSPTEQRNSASRRLSRLGIPAAIDLMLAEEARVIPALLEIRRDLAQAVKFATAALRASGRLFYCGAGTSGRLGVLDASECPPTFRSPPEQVQGIMAGGQEALWRAMEGAEDDFAAGEAAIRFRGVIRKDFVVGIAASGRTPFVWGCLKEARARGARIGLICFNPNLKFARGTKPDVVICPAIGPEVLTGSTRLKAGTATKLILNSITTLTMVQLGKAISNLMVDVNPSNVKLRDRAVRILCELGVKDESEALRLLEANGWVIKKAWEAAARKRKKSS